jgi:hypothetical protein
LGGAQFDITFFQAENFDCDQRSFCNSRKKTANMGGMKPGVKAREGIERRPRTASCFRT